MMTQDPFASSVLSFVGTPFHYPPVWQCIYCGETDSAHLTNEHIIPISLGGHLILDKSSCKKCSAITRDFEQTIARTMFGPFRVKYNVKTRNPKIRPTHFSIGIIDKNGQPKRIKILAQEYHAATFVYKFTRPKIILGLPPNISDLEWTFCIQSSKHNLDALKDKYNWDGRIVLKTTPLEFVRLIAKIAHSYTVAHIGLDKFTPFLPPLILGNGSGIGYYVGGAYHTVNSLADDLEPAIPSGCHLLQGKLGVLQFGSLKRLIIGIEVRLFADFPNCTYTAIVGEIATPDQRARFIKDCVDTGRVKLSISI